MLKSFFISPLSSFLLPITIIENFLHYFVPMNTERKGDQESETKLVFDLPGKLEEPSHTTDRAHDLQTHLRLERHRQLREQLRPGVLHLPEGEREALQDGHQHPQRQPLPHQAEGLLHRVQRHRQHDPGKVCCSYSRPCRFFIVTY